MVYCGMALGYADETAAVNSLRSERAPVANPAGNSAEGASVKSLLTGAILSLGRLSLNERSFDRKALRRVRGLLFSHGGIALLN